MLPSGQPTSASLSRTPMRQLLRSPHRAAFSHLCGTAPRVLPIGENVSRLRHDNAPPASCKIDDHAPRTYKRTTTAAVLSCPLPASITCGRCQCSYGSVEAPRRAQALVKLISSPKSRSLVPRIQETLRFTLRHCGARTATCRIAGWLASGDGGTGSSIMGIFRNKCQATISDSSR
jgi:hypothetical protein